jgi:hypothetical protein
MKEKKEMKNFSMKKLIIFLLSHLLFFAGFIFCKKIKTFDELLRPHQIGVDKSQLYIADGPTVYIYSLKDLSFKTKFGKAGEGPEEFKIVGNREIITDVSSEYIIVNSIGRVSFFTKEGTFIKEINTVFGRNFKPMGKYFVGFHYISRKKGSSDRLKAVKIYDSKLNEIKEICRMEGRYERGKGYRMFCEPHVFRVYKGKIFVGGREDFKIEVLNEKGEKLFFIKQEYERVKVREKHKNAILNHIDTSPRYKDIRDFFKSVLIFPKDFPAIRDFFVVDGKVYVLTYKKKEENTELFVFDIDGRFIKKTFIPMVEDNLHVVTNPYVFGNGQLYQLIESENEEWELHVHEL